VIDRDTSNTLKQIRVIDDYDGQISLSIGQLCVLATASFSNESAPMTKLETNELTSQN